MGKELFCTICIGVIFRPVTLPCHHAFCKECIETALELTAYQCPICRFRLSNWLRNMKDVGMVVDLVLEAKVRCAFPEYYRRLELGLTPMLSESEQRFFDELTNPTRAYDGHSASPGELYGEYIELLKRVYSERQLEAEKNEEASLALAFQLLSEDELLYTSDSNNHNLSFTDNSTFVDPGRVSPPSNTPLYSNESTLKKRRSNYNQQQQQQSLCSSSRSNSTLLDYAVYEDTTCQTQNIHNNSADFQVSRDEAFARKLQTKFNQIDAPSPRITRSKRRTLRSRR